jgi:hypothetical protein
MKRSALLLAGIALTSPASAFNLAKITSGKPEGVVSGKGAFYPVERCVMMIDASGPPVAYRTPDRPEESLIYWSGGQGPIVFKLERAATGVTITIYNGMRFKDKLQECADTA